MSSGSARVRAVEVSGPVEMRRVVLGVLRTRSALDAELAAACKPSLDRLVPGLREILEVALYQIRHLDRVPAYAAVDEAVTHAKATGGEKAGGLVNAVLRAILRRGLPSEALAKEGEGANIVRDLSVRFSHPEFLVSRWLERFGQEQAVRVLEADNAGSPLDLVVNPRKTDREALTRALAAQGADGRLHSNALRQLPLKLQGGEAEVFRSARHPRFQLSVGLGHLGGPGL